MSEVLPDIPRIYTALAEWLSCIVYISILKKKITRWNIVTISGIVLIVQALFLISTKDLHIMFWLPSMLVAFGIMYLLIYLTCDISAKEAGYFTVRAFVAAEFVAAFEWQVHFFFLESVKDNLLLEVLLMIVIYGISFLLIGMIEKRHTPDEGKLNIRNRELWSTVIMGAAVFSISNLSFVTTRTPFSGQYAREIFNIRTMVDLGGLAVLFAYHIQLNELRTKHELKAIQNILQNQYLQYQQSKESIEIINYKYHDLKNQIIALRAMDDEVKRNAYLTEMENEIKLYEAENKTGNQILDTVLTSKNIYCIKHGITLTSVVDGTLLNHMDVMDITTIFGNALDNAIEYEQNINDREKRLIHVSVFSQKGFLIIRVENYFDGELTIEGDLPVTTKKDTFNHGYGLKSIRYSVQKYDGVVTVKQRNNWFELKVLIPLPK